MRGLSHNNVWRVSFPSTQIIVKHSVKRTEAAFYQDVAPALIVQGVATPALEWLHQEDEGAWLVLEYIPEPLPKERRLADPRVMTVLSRLHRAQLPSAALPLFNPTWDDTMTNQALTSFSKSEQTRLASLIQRLQHESQPLFHAQTWISGDPNVMNWGVRANGDTVLYDWERFGRGTPALDLAISIPGLGDWTAFEQVANQYLRAAGAQPSRQHYQRLVQAIAYAKVWNVIEFLSFATTGEITETTRIPSLAQQLPDWIRMMSSLLTSDS
jgi:aminoglycoside phosphotransferase (APT) family kinase protein